MKRNLRFKFAFIVAVILVCIYGVIGLPTSWQQVVDNWHKNIRLGLDLRGGTYLVVQVQQQDAFNAKAGTDADRLKDDARKAGVTLGNVEVIDATNLANAPNVAINVKGVPAAQAGQFRTIVNNDFPDWITNPIGTNDYRLTLKREEALSLWTQVLTETKNTIEKKINALGLSEATVQQRRGDADSELMVEMPGVDDPARVKQILQTTAVLELYDVKAGPFQSVQEALTQSNGVLPPDTKLVGKPSGTQSGKGGGIYVVARNPVVRGPDIRDARPEPGNLPNTWNTSFVLSQEAASHFAAYTGSHIGSHLAIVLDGIVLEAPVIKNQISDNGVIEGAGTQQEASDLALNLRAGSLPASIVYMQEDTVGPSLGADSIHQGFIAGIAGVLAVIFVMLVYYKKSGINATLALILNAVILIACLSYFDAVLTLPGIAGVILTIGMAVDSNVLIFERIREEVRAGKGPMPAVDTGFSKAILTIIDTHVTTVVSCAIL
ncbi:MAG TPA: protein translocase subunit SecD, partial [Bryobacteraceae bacterium]|nr:protein translocase subunit SecD [Bryobacteraceae bacterium]